MKKIVLTFCAAIALLPAIAQITISASDMPVVGDTLRYSIVSSAGTTFSIGDSGTNKTWDYSMMTAIAQAVDTYKSVTTVSPLFALTIAPGAYGYKVADGIPGLSGVSPVTINNVYTFFSKKSSPSRFVAEGFGASIAGVPTPAAYSDEDEWYVFPLNYASTNASTFSVKFSVPSVVSIKMAGTRKTSVDGWGTIKTPYTASPVSCIRLRSVINEVDSITFGTTSMGLPRNTVEYKFLATGEHYPLMWVTTTLTGSSETVTTVRYRDTKRSTASIGNLKPSYQVLNVYPNPSSDGQLNIAIPNNWKDYTVELFDLQSRKVLSASNSNHFNISQLAAGNYILRVVNGEETGIAQIEKK